MKTLQCPLCGGSFELFEEGANIYLYQCLDCPLASSVSYTEKGALENAKELISKFPPIMRVWPGDKLQVEDGSICEVINVNKNLAMMDVRRGEGRPVFTIADNHVIRWPWELDQKGGSND